MKRTLMMVPLAAVCAACADAPEYDARAALPGFDSPAAEWWRADSSWTIAPVRAYGTADGPLAFGYIMGVAVHANGTLGVADYQSCTVTLISRPGGELLRQLGRCGDGPAEFRQVRAVAFHGDSLLVYDQSRGDVAILDTAGRELARHRVPLRPPSAIMSMAVVDDSTLLVSAERSPYDTGPAEAADSLIGLVGLLDLRTGAVREWLGADAPLSTIGSPNAIRRMSACLRPDRAAPVVVMLNTWLLEGVALELPQKRELFHFITDTPLQPTQLEDGSWSPGSMITRAVWCGESGALFRVSRPRPPVPGQPTRAAETYLEMRAWDGTPLLRTSVTEPTSPLHGGFGTMLGDTLFVAGTGVGAFPVVTEFVVR